MILFLLTYGYGRWYLTTLEIDSMYAAWSISGTLILSTGLCDLYIYIAYCVIMYEIIYHTQRKKIFMRWVIYIVVILQLVDFN